MQSHDINLAHGQPAGARLQTSNSRGRPRYNPSDLMGFRQFGRCFTMPACGQSCWPAVYTNSTKHGAVAQLGERCVRNAEVEGSIPFRSTNLANGRKYRSFFYAKAARHPSVSHMPWRDAPRSTRMDNPGRKAGGNGESRWLPC